ncbi:hypothetical protein M0802_007095 [Mischocyttarus mexicanus]|nr:hypothetical protein M0802_007095 [Mischocyttarus mexicanus]
MRYEGLQMGKILLRDVEHWWDLNPVRSIICVATNRKSGQVSLYACTMLPVIAVPVVVVVVVIVVVVVASEDARVSKLRSC